VHESDLLAPPSQDRQANPLLMRVSNAGGPTVAARDGEVYPLPPGYMPGPHGGVQLRPDYAKTLPKGPFDFGGMAREIGWPGVVNSLNHIAAGVFTSKANDQIGEWLHLPEWLDLPKVGRETLDAQIEANKDPKTQPRGADRVTNGLP
jgi:hypothetical protein